jgi:purine nucleoside phosphorylase
MPIGIITGSGTQALPDFEGGEQVAVDTPWGRARVARGSFGGVDVLHVSRHGAGHPRLSSGVNHRANIFALRQLGASAVIGCTACGAVDASLPLGSLVIFDDLHFIANRLPSGELCTFFVAEGDPARAHWILHGGPYSEGLRSALEGAAAAAGLGHRGHGTYGHVDGPRFNTPAEIAQLAACGVSAVSQTGGPETVLCGEAGLPFALVGFVTDYANEVVPGEPTPVSTLSELMGRSTTIFAALLRGAVPRIEADPPTPAGTVYRIGSEAGSD